MSGTATKYDSTLGSMLISTLLCFALWGISCVQTFDYFMNNQDGRLQRLVIALLITAETVGSVMDAHMCYYYMVQNYTNPASLAINSWSITGNTLVIGVSNTVIRCMFARRIYKFSGKKKWITLWIVLISIASFAVCVAIFFISVRGVTVDPVSLITITHLLYASFALGVTADFSVALALCRLLQSAKTGFRKSDSIVNVLMTYVVNTGALVTLDAMLGLITYVAVPNTMVFLPFYFTMSKLYLNAYLATLNARPRLREKDWDSSLPLSGLDSRHSAKRTTWNNTDEKNVNGNLLRSPTLSISLQTTVERKIDVDEAISSPTMV